jgi:hypothetical protein
MRVYPFGSLLGRVSQGEGIVHEQSHMGRALRAGVYSPLRVLGPRLVRGPGDAYQCSSVATILPMASHKSAGTKMEPVSDLKLIDERDDRVQVDLTAPGSKRSFDIKQWMH